MSEALCDVVEPAAFRRVLGRTVLAEVAGRYGLTFEQISARNYAPEICEVRDEAMWEARQRTSLSYPQIGRLLGGRHHAAIIAGERRHEARRKALAGVWS